MLGTLDGALEVRQVRLPVEDLVAEVEGLNEIVDGLPVLREIRVRYRLRIPADARDRVERALARHQDKCPTAATLAPSVRVSWTAEITEI
jgi:uncharacterized OsmC-like protein